VLVLHLDPKNSARDSFVMQWKEATATVEAPLTTIDKLSPELGISRVDFIKMDIEGAEKQALNGARATLAKYKPELAIATEHYATDSETNPAGGAAAGSPISGRVWPGTPAARADGMLLAHSRSALVSRRFDSAMAGPDPVVFHLLPFLLSGPGGECPCHDSAHVNPNHYSFVGAGEIKTRGGVARSEAPAIMKNSQITCVFS